MAERSTGGTILRCGWRLLAFCVWTAFALPAAWATSPPNAERLFTARTCKDALARVREAATGNPGISADENRTHLMAAIGEAERICLAPAKKGRQGSGATVEAVAASRSTLKCNRLRAAFGDSRSTDPLGLSSSTDSAILS